MLTLGIDTSTKVASVALIKSSQLVSEVFLHTGNDHSGQLMPMINKLLELSQVQPQQLTGVAVAIGPGSFTGLRIGLATGKAFASALDIPLIGIPTLDGLAYNLAGTSGIICPILDARKKQVYSCIYCWDKGGLVKLSSYLVEEPAKLVDRLIALDKGESIHFLGDAVTVYQQQLIELLGNRQLNFVHPPNSLARGAQIAWLGEKKILAGLSEQEKDYHQVTPLYLRVSEAEAALQKKKGNCS